MKKRLIVLLLVLVLMLPLWHIASANAPALDPNAIVVTCTSLENETEVALLIAGEDGNFRVRDSGVSTKETYSFIFYREEGDTQFCVVLTAPDGTQLRSEPHSFREGYTYIFDAETCELKEEAPSKNCNSEVVVILLVLAFLSLLFALGLTVVIEMLVGLCFRLRPIRWVVLINLITNPVMNILLLIVTMTFGGSGTYFIACAILEAAACGLEFWFYTRKYKERKKWVLLIFTLVANAASAAVGLLSYILLFC